MGELSWNALKQIVYERANGCCEYCQTCEANSGQTMQVDHIDPRGRVTYSALKRQFALDDAYAATSKTPCS
jgi:5-methylcytosine-specific restriction endonuclease McrA